MPNTFALDSPEDVTLTFPSTDTLIVFPFVLNVFIPETGYPLCLSVPVNSLITVTFFPTEISVELPEPLFS